MSNKNLRIGYVPEHFSTPLHYAVKYFGLDAELIAFPSGTGHMITSLRSRDIDVGIGLTEGWVAGLGKEDLEGDGGYRIVGTYVDTPLCWAISTGSKRSDITSVSSLQNSKCGVSRIGSGSYVMSFVLADQKHWLSDSPSTNPPFTFTPLHTFAKLREGVNNSEVDFFMWEHFTSKKYYDNGEIKRVGEIYTPWSSWKIVATTDQKRYKKEELEEKLEKLFVALDQGVEYFETQPDESVEYISTNLDYSKEDAKEWLKTVKFTKGTRGVKLEVIEKTVSTLQKAGVLTSKGLKPTQMVQHTK